MQSGLVKDSRISAFSYNSTMEFSIGTGMEKVTMYSSGTVVGYSQNIQVQRVYPFNPLNAEGNISCPTNQDTYVHSCLQLVIQFQ
jgi:hypothetical protein